MKVRLGGEWKEITGAKVFLAAAWRTLAAIKVFVDGAWRDVANFTSAPEVAGFTASAPSSVTTVASLSTIRSSVVTVTPSGGLAPYAYSWTVDGDATANTPSKASTSFTATAMQFEETRECTASCIVADSLGSAVVVTISLTFQRA